MRSWAKPACAGVLGIFFSFMGMSSALAQGSNVSTVDILGAIPVIQPLNGLGFGIDPTSDLQFRMAAAAGATHVRFQCGWGSVETQTANNTNGPSKFILPPDCAAGLKSSLTYGIRPTVVAAYGPPFHDILYITLPSGAAKGDTSVKIQLQGANFGATLAKLTPYIDSLMGPNGAYVTNVHSYAGGLITDVTLIDSTHAMLTLASAISSTLPASTTPYVIRENLYAPPANFSPKDPSVLAYANYATFLAKSIAAVGLTGEVEIWNEPPWGDDPWDARQDLYDKFLAPTTLGPFTAGMPDFGFVAALQANGAPAPGVTFNWGGTEKSGFNTLMEPSQMMTNTGVAFAQPNSVFTTESFHPYGNWPEQVLWNPVCLNNTTGNNDFYTCNYLGVYGGNFSKAVQQSLIAQRKNPANGIGHNISETGFSSNNSDEAHKARFIMRQFLGYQAAGVTPVQFYNLYDTSGNNFSFLNPTKNADGTLSPLSAYTAIAGLMSDMAAIKIAPVASYPLTSLASVASYSGTYPLEAMHIVGAAPGAKANSDLMVVWQRSSVTTGYWAQLAQPAAAPVTVNIPSGMRVSSVINLDTRALVSYTSTAQQISFQVSDDPIEILCKPFTMIATTLTLTPQPSSSTYGKQVELTAKVSPSQSGNYLNNGENITFYDASTILGTATLSSGVASLSTTSLQAGTHSLTATYSGDNNFVTSSGSANFTIAPAIPTLAAPNFTFVATTTNVPAPKGSNSSFTLTVSPINGFDQDIHFECAGLPPGMQCIFSPSVIVLSGGPSTSVMTISQLNRQATSKHWSLPLWTKLGSGISMALLFLPRRRWSIRRMFLLPMLLAGSMLMSGCGQVITFSSMVNVSITATGVNVSKTITVTTTMPNVM